MFVWLNLGTQVFVCFVFNKLPDDSFDKANLEDTELDNLLNPFQSYQCRWQSIVGRALGGQ